jgi:hypothetical protein
VFCLLHWLTGGKRARCCHLHASRQILRHRTENWNTNKKRLTLSSNIHLFFPLLYIFPSINDYTLYHVLVGISYETLDMIDTLYKLLTFYTSYWHSIQVIDTLYKLLTLYTSYWRSIQVIDALYKLLTLYTSYWRSIQVIDALHKLLNSIQVIDTLYKLLTLYTSHWHSIQVIDTLYKLLTLYTSYWHSTQVIDTLYKLLTLYTSYWHSTQVIAYRLVISSPLHERDKIVPIFPFSVALFMISSCLYITLGSRGSSGSIVSAYGQNDRVIGVRSLAGAKDFSCSLCVQTGSGAHPASCPMGTGVPFPGGKARPGRDVDRSHHLVPRSWMSRSYTSSPPSASMACSGTSLLFYSAVYLHVSCSTDTSMQCGERPTEIIAKPS